MKSKLTGRSLSGEVGSPCPVGQGPSSSGVVAIGDDQTLAYSVDTETESESESEVRS